MQARTIRRVSVALVTTAAVAIPLAGGGSTAVAGPYDVGTGPVTIKMKLKFVGKGKKRHPVPFFSGPAKVSSGAKMTIVNTTSPKAIGPHTFSLVKPALIPKGAKAQAKCSGEKALADLCLTIAKAHKIDFKTFKINKPTVDVGAKGWDTSFGSKGDTWFTQKKGAKQSRIVSADAGTTLTYFCAVHPNMVGKIKVVS